MLQLEVFEAFKTKLKQERSLEISETLYIVYISNKGAFVAFAF